jgi:hypothetical protein
MLCISNHRVINSYKMRATVSRRASRNSVYRRRNSYSKKDATTQVDLSLLKRSITALVPQSIMVNRTITVNNESYMVELPQEFDIYEGLRTWYPTLYEMVLEELAYERNQYDACEMSDDDAWAKYDYLEWMCD